MKSSLFLLLLLSSPAWALKTAYVTFDHPEGWGCEFSGGVWICQSTVEPERKESVVLSIATLATDWDTIENFEDYLKTPREIEDENGTKFRSEVRYVRKRNVNGHVWVDSLQLNSELPGFWARYVATINTTPKAKLAILITYIVSEERYKQLAPEFERMVSSLKLNNDFDLPEPTKQGQPPLPTADTLGPLQSNILKDRLRKGPSKKEEPQTSPVTYLVLLGLIAGVSYFIIRRRKNAKKTMLTRTPPSNKPPANRKVS